MIGKERRSMHFMNFIDFIGRFDSRFIFSFYSASVFYIVRPVRLDRSVKAFLTGGSDRVDNSGHRRRISNEINLLLQLYI